MNAAWISAFIALWVVVLFLCVVLLGLLRRIGNVLEQAEQRLAASADGSHWGGLPVGSRVPRFNVRASGPSADPTMTSADLLQEPTLLLFMEGGCGPCRNLADELRGSGAKIAGVPIHIVFSDEHGPADWVPDNIPTVFEHAGEVSRAFQNVATPQAYLVDANHTILAKRTVGSHANLIDMVVQKGGEPPADHGKVSVA
jgi:hypothetical protein